MTVEQAKQVNKEAFMMWRAWGYPEAYDLLNNSNRELMTAYALEFPEAVGLKVYSDGDGIFKISYSELYNFCCDFIFNGTTENLQRIKNAVGIYRKTLASEDLEKLQTEIDKINGIRLMWA